MSEQILTKVKKADKHFHRLRYVLRAKPKDDVRYYLNYLYVDDRQRLIACDGHRLHIAQSDSLRPGFYEVIKNLKSEVWLASVPDIDAGEFPEFDKAILSTKPKIKKQQIMCSARSPDQSIFHVFSYFQVCLNTGYVRDALCDDFSGLFVMCKDSLSPVFFEYDNGDVVGVVMPMKVDPVSNRSE